MWRRSRIDCFLMILSTSLSLGDFPGLLMVSFYWLQVRGFKTCNKLHHQQIRLIFSTLFMDFSKNRLISLRSCYPVSSRTPLAFGSVHIFISCLISQMMTQYQLWSIFHIEWSLLCQPSIMFWYTIRKVSCPSQFWKVCIMTRSMICLGWAHQCSWLLPVMVFVRSFSLIIILLVRSWRVTQKLCQKISGNIMLNITRWTSNPISIRQTKWKIKDLPKLRSRVNEILWPQMV